MLTHPLPNRLDANSLFIIVFIGKSDQGVSVPIITGWSLLPEYLTKYLAKRSILKRKLEQLYYTGFTLAKKYINTETMWKQRLTKITKDTGVLLVHLWGLQVYVT